MHTTASEEKIHEALSLLNEAAKDKREEIAGLLSTKYTAVREAITDSADWAKKKGKAARDAARDAAETVDDSAHANPWPYVGGAAFAGLLLGLLLSRKR